MTGSGPVIPNFGNASRCVTENHWFCPSWVSQNWHGTLEPALVQHVKLTAIAVSIGFAIAFLAALAAYRFRRLDQPIGLASDFLYTIPSLALFQILVPYTGLGWLTVEVGLVGYTLLILFRNILAGLRGVPDDVLEAGRGMGLTRHQILTRIELPLALPAIMAGIRIAVVTAISLATVAAYVTPLGLGQPIFYGLQSNFTTEFIATGALAVLLAITADLLLVGAQRLLTPWAGARRAR